MAEQGAGVDRRRPRPRLDRSKEGEPTPPRPPDALLGRPEPWLLERYLDRVIPWARRGPTGALLLLAAQPRGLLEADDESTANLARAAIVQRLAGTLRGSDFQVALSNGEFAVVLEATSPQEATPVVERLRRIIHSVDARGAIGVVPIDGSQDAAGVLAQARAALAQAQATAATGDAPD